MGTGDRRGSQSCGAHPGAPSPCGARSPRDRISLLCLSFPFLRGDGLGPPWSGTPRGPPWGGMRGVTPPGCPAGRGCWLGRGAVQGGREGDLPVPGAVPACRASRCPRPGCTSRGGARPLRAPGPSCPLCSSPGTPRGTPAPRHCNPFSSGLGVPVGPKGAQRPPPHPAPTAPAPEAPPGKRRSRSRDPLGAPPARGCAAPGGPGPGHGRAGGSRCLFPSAAGAGRGVPRGC